MLSDFTEVVDSVHIFVDVHGSYRNTMALVLWVDYPVLYLIASVVLAEFFALFAGAPNRGGWGGRNPPLNFGWGFEHVSTPPPDFEKIFIRGGGGLAPLKLI